MCSVINWCARDLLDVKCLRPRIVSPVPRLQRKLRSIQIYRQLRWPHVRVVFVLIPRHAGKGVSCQRTRALKVRTQIRTKLRAPHAQVIEVDVIFGSPGLVEAPTTAPAVFKVNNVFRMQISLFAKKGVHLGLRVWVKSLLGLGY